MALSTGAKLGHYEILGPIGKGGMGEVYRARDPRLNRDVAIKVSAQKFSDRFAREAKVIASLNHPNICTLYDVGPDYLVMELVEGPTLAERIKDGPLPLEEALKIAKQIAAALEAAHEKPVIHRDLKPGNVKIRPDGTVKVLDFGLAKIGNTPVAAGDDSPTLTMGETQAGVILGTAAYMSPEQAKGKPVDKRADIWSFGVVLYEMLTGRRLFAGETVTETLAAVIEREPDWSRVPAKAQPLLRRCLEKDPQKRLRDIGEAMAWVENVPAAATSPAGAPSQQRFGSRAAAWAVAGVLVLIAAALGILYFRKPLPPPEAQTRFRIPLPDNASNIGGFSVSPDGRRLVFAAAVGTDAARLWIRTLDSLESHPLPDTEGGFLPVWSPDSRFIAFSSQGKLKKMDVSGGPPQTICDVPDFPGIGGGSWNREGEIIFGGLQGLMKVPATGGTPSLVAAVDATKGEAVLAFPSFLPDGRHFVYLSFAVAAENRAVYLGSLDAKPEEQHTRRLLAANAGLGFIPAPDGSSGQLLFLREGTLLAQALDTRRLELAGEPIPLAERVGVFPQFPIYGLFSSSANGVLAYRTGGGGAASQPTWFDRQGKIQGAAGDPGPYRTLALSPDATRAAVLQAGDLWVVDLVRNTSARLTFTRAVLGSGVWSPDGNQVAFAANNGGVLGIYRKATSGAGKEELVWKVESGLLGPTHWSADGRFLLVGVNGGKTGPDIWVVPMKGDRKPFVFLNGEFGELGGRFSPDGKWIAYISNESGRGEIYVQPFNPDAGAGAAAPAGKWLVSKGGSAGMPRWRSDGKEIYHMTLDGRIMAVDISTSPVFRAGEQKQLFQVPAAFVRSQAPGALADATADGKRFMFLAPEGALNTPEQFTVVTNWMAALKK